MSQSLQNLLEGIYSSVLEARRFVNMQHLKLFQSYFETRVITDPDTGEKIEVYVPRLVAMATSKGVGDQETFEIFEAAAVTLVPMSTLSIDTLEIEFETKLTNLDVTPTAKPDSKSEGEEATDADDVEDDSGIIRRTIDDLFGTASEITIMPKGDSFQSSTSPAKVKINFKMSDPPEGVSLIQEQLLDYLRT
ncbi:DUF2589 domain-containing protein [Kiloniella laminariae]|uniref:DUF2589 domain-containing protein n=1 Tax=Kiloniella laminariae TaxID=454162 RepID=A0ABT4LHX5_9PROT|nr:DUF2589 domain-containing protein [Kiloniella laminariae]MCZ4280697.1 DUF2589 domain-containing protein [Kiloniella laminariae]